MWNAKWGIQECCALERKCLLFVEGTKSYDRIFGIVSSQETEHFIPLIFGKAMYSHSDWLNECVRACLNVCVCVYYFIMFVLIQVFRMRMYFCCFLFIWKCRLFRWIEYQIIFILANWAYLHRLSAQRRTHKQLYMTSQDAWNYCILIIYHV